MKQHTFIPIILGTAINAYNMAISFHEEYGIKPIIVGREPLVFTSLSSVIGEREYNTQIFDNHTFLEFLNKIAIKYKKEDKKLLLIGTEDVYVRLIIKNRDKLKMNYVFNYIDESLMDNLYFKKNFYKLCEEYGIDTPNTYYYSCLEEKSFREDVVFPVIIKPSDGVEYNRNPFKGLQKIYKVNSYQEINKVTDMVTASGYQGDLVIQEFIPGDDTYMWDSVYYGNSKGKGELITFAQVVLQEHTVTAVGNYTALIIRYNEEMMEKLKNFLDAIGYVGFANFDLKFDHRDGKFKVFEVNIRQGRSSYYVTACGHNMARYLVDDVIYGKSKPLTYLDKDFLFTVVPKIVLNKFVDNEEVKGEIKKLLREGKYGNPLFYKKDKSIKRKIYLLARQVNYYQKYKNNKW